MKPIAIIYGSSGGNTKDVAKKIAKKLVNAEVTLIDVSKASVTDFETYSNLILGTSTWGFGDLQDDWDGFLSKLKSINLENKTIALFGLGDSSSYSDSFVDGMGILYETIKDKDCKIIGYISAERYNYDSSRAEEAGMFVGLALDEDNEYDKTDNRINDWLSDISPKFQ
ncbi:MAG: flavodoxin [Paludibacter sp.]|nr:flavodoxin [Paludibacter sp.]